MSLKLLLIQLNEINFDLVSKYLSASKKNKFKNLKIIENNFKFFNTYAEDEYENLEPWIQWVSVYLGKDLSGHKIFRLGDIVNYSGGKQIFEKIEDKGFKVGAISPMNADNRLENASYFIPDPWTKNHSHCTNYGFSKRLSSMLSQTVNDNASGNLSFSSLLTIMEIIFRALQFKDIPFLVGLVFSSILKPWKKSLVLDYLIHITHIYFLKKKLPNFSSVFFNAGAHIQHHYFNNTKLINNLPKNPKWYVDPLCDPIEDMLEIYDKIIGDYLNLSKNEIQLLIATGLSQKQYDSTKFYYRLKNHCSFLNKIGVNYLKVLPRMTRDFEIIFENNQDLIHAKNILENIRCEQDNTIVFNEVDERNKSLFITLTYPHEIEKKKIIIINNNKKLNFYNEVVFVAIKNGMHDSKGYVFYSPSSHFTMPKNPIHVSKLHDMILSYFN